MNHHIFPTYSISIGPNWLKELQKNIWDEKPVPSVMEVDKLPYEICISYRGDSINCQERKELLL
jgi:spore coat protein H